MKEQLITGWRVALAQHSECKDRELKTVAEVANAYELTEATVPGSLEQELIKRHLLPEDLYFGTNILETQKWESTHLFYTAEITVEDNGTDPFLVFGGIDTAAEIYCDGALLGTAENMLIPYEFAVTPGKHGIVVHITPANVYSRRQKLSQLCRAQKYNMDSLVIRKAPYMYGWDIMPRTVSAGLWRPVKIEYRACERLADVNLRLFHLFEDHAMLTLTGRVLTDRDQLSELTVAVEGVCGESRFTHEEKLMNGQLSMFVNVNAPKLWWPKNYGEQNLYDTTVRLKTNDAVLDEVTLRIGLRTVELERTSLAGPEGKFRFVVNNKPIFVNGTNWVPTDALPARHADYTLRGLELAEDLNCNIIRCWGGNVYPDDELYDFCDEHGILVWQDFSMACGRYPEDDRFLALLKQEAESVVKRLRHHACLALWSGDNECDCSYLWGRTMLYDRPIYQGDPNKSRVTRGVLPDIISQNDGYRPYLPSSPYLDEVAIKGGSPAEDHLWGPRDYFKGDFYKKNSVCHFASETGYHGCPSPATLRKIMPEEALSDRGDGKICENPYWLAHATCMVLDGKAPYAYRIPIMTRQVERLFGTVPADIDAYALESQISQGEAVKFFIEHFRAQRGYRSGIIWWNVIDGWPQVSDAVVDWYGTKKLAYEYIKRAQKPFMMMMDEPDEQGRIALLAVNDSRKPVTVSYTVENALTGEMLAKGTVTCAPDANENVVTLPEDAAYYLIRWTGDETGLNHFVGRIGDTVKHDDYVAFMKKAELWDKREGF